MRDSRSRMLATVGVGVGLVLTLGLTTGARWVDAVDIAGTSMTSGVLDISVDPHGTLDLTQALPGVTTTSQLTVSNDGSVPFDYAVDVSGSGGLFDALAIRIALDDCGGPLVGANRTLAPGHSQEICVRVTLPGSAAASAAGASTPLTVSVAGTNGGWSDAGVVTGSSISTVALVKPTLSCGSGILGAITLGWAAVPQATAYRIHYGSSGNLVETVPATTLSRTFIGVAGVATVEAVFGSDAWVSAPSAPLAYSALAGLLGHCG